MHASTRSRFSRVHVDRAAQALLERRLGPEAELPLRLRGAAEAAARAVPVPRGATFSSEVLSVSSRTAAPARGSSSPRRSPGCRRRRARRCSAQRIRPRDDVVDVDEVAARDAAVVDWQRHALERAVDERRRHVPPDRRRRAAPLAGAEDLARAVDVLEARPHRRQAVLLVVVDASRTRRRSWRSGTGCRARARPGRPPCVASASSYVFSARACSPPPSRRPSSAARSP